MSTNWSRDAESRVSVPFRASIEVGVQLVADLGERKRPDNVVLEDHPNDRCPDGVSLEELLFASLTSLVRVRVRDLAEAVRSGRSGG
jgi:hypothetical protein